MKTYNILSIGEFKREIAKISRLIGIDPGKKNIGIAICDENKIVATPLKTIQNVKFEILSKQINQIIEENSIKGIVVGNPLNMDGTVGKQSKSALNFAKKLSTYTSVPIIMWDERLSSQGSFKITQYLDTNISSKIKKLDENSAAFILQGFIDHLSK